MAKASADFRNQLDEADDFVEVKGGDFARVHDFEEVDTLIGTYLGREEKSIKGEDRVIHHFDLGDEKVDAWGAAILDSRLEQVSPGSRVKVVYRGKTTTGAGRRAKDFAVFVARSALKGGA